VRKSQDLPSSGRGSEIIATRHLDKEFEGVCTGEMLVDELTAYAQWGILFQGPDNIRIMTPSSITTPRKTARRCAATQVAS